MTERKTLAELALAELLRQEKEKRMDLDCNHFANEIEAVVGSRTAAPAGALAAPGVLFGDLHALVAALRARDIPGVAAALRDILSNALGDDAQRFHAQGESGVAAAALPAGLDRDRLVDILAELVKRLLRARE